MERSSSFESQTECIWIHQSRTECMSMSNELSVGGGGKESEFLHATGCSVLQCAAA